MKVKTMFVAIAFAALALTLGSCKKDWTCTCTSTAGSSSGTTTKTITDMTKKDAKTKCDEDDSSITSGGATASTDCSIS